MMKDEPRTWFGRLMRRPLSERIACLVIVVGIVWAIVLVATDAPTPQSEPVALPAYLLPPVVTPAPTEQAPSTADIEYVQELQPKILAHAANLEYFATVCGEPRVYDPVWYATLADAINRGRSSGRDLLDIDPPAKFIRSKNVLDAAVSEQMLALTAVESAMASGSAAGLRRAGRMMLESSKTMEEANAAFSRDAFGPE